MQRHLEAFHKSIRLSLGESRTLRQKRDAVCRRVEARLPGIFEEAGEDCPLFEFRDQGSYQMGTGVFPLDRDFDIDLGLYFEIDPDEYHPVELKRRVHAALEGHTPGDGVRDGVRIRRPCVTVQYHRAGEPVYHVDIAVYSDGSLSRDGKPRLALGKGRSDEKFCGWEVSDPRALASLILGSRSGEELTQFRRVV
ncbi:MAG TPA: nucleotidyltransferase, partial [Longimicrobiaceae bacterium]|nr:nucleotidyltransferase [Longimicrobiaceae bacterium]